MKKRLIYAVEVSDFLCESSYLLSPIYSTREAAEKRCERQKARHSDDLDTLRFKVKTFDLVDHAL